MPGRTNSQNNHGFSLIEMSIVLVVVGIILSMTLPVVRGMVKTSKYNKERAYLEETKNALIGYAFIHGGFPDPLPNDIVPAGKLGIRAIGPYAKPFLYDVNPTFLASNTGGDMSTFCAAIEAEQTAANPPLIWNGTDFSDTANSAPVAFVVVSQGANYRSDRENSPLGDGTLADRYYENPSTAEQEEYDDAVVSYSLVQLSSDCLKVAPPVVQQTACAASGDARCAELTNNSGQELYYAIARDWNSTEGVCRAIANGQHEYLGIWDKEMTLYVSTSMDAGRTDLKCSSSNSVTFKKLREIDSNDDDLMASVECNTTERNACGLY
ncbi:MAG: type II secretion system GspH family protein [Gammaproteobacteria bacterium]|nr:type II secretion system GspH family protein [Gammaproteobacteria bacterium]